MEQAISGAIGLVFGGLFAWLALRSLQATAQARLALLEKELEAAEDDLKRLLAEQREWIAQRASLEASIQSERRANTEKMELLTRAGADLQNAFKALERSPLNARPLSYTQVRPRMRRQARCFNGAHAHNLVVGHRRRDVRKAHHGGHPWSVQHREPAGVGETAEYIPRKQRQIHGPHAIRPLSPCPVERHKRLQTLAAQALGDRFLVPGLGGQREPCV